MDRKRLFRRSVVDLLILSSSYLNMVVSNTTCFFVSKSFKNLDFKGNLQ